MNPKPAENKPARQVGIMLSWKTGETIFVAQDKLYFPLSDQELMVAVAENLPVMFPQNYSAGYIIEDIAIKFWPSLGEYLEQIRALVVVKMDEDCLHFAE